MIGIDAIVPVAVMGVLLDTVLRTVPLHVHPVAVAGGWIEEDVSANGGSADAIDVPVVELWARELSSALIEAVIICVSKLPMVKVLELWKL